MISQEDKRGLMTLGKLFAELHLPESVSDIVVNEIVTNSKHVERGNVFVALKGQKFDGTQFIDDAIRLEASAVVIESTQAVPAGTINYRDGIAIISAGYLSERVSELASLCWSTPSKKLKVIGVTGTNGKSTCVSLIAQLHNLLGGKAAAMGTVGLDYEGDKVVDFAMTTPDAATCQKSLALLAKRGAELVAMEVSSHGLIQHRVAAVDFDVAVFTNLTLDHLDYHGTMEDYSAAKQKLFNFAGLKAAVINLDDAHASKMLFASKNRAKVYSYSLLHFVADFFASEIEYSARGINFTLTSPWGVRQVNSPLIGKFNIYNVIAAIAAVCAVGADFNVAVDAVPKLVSVSGRMQKAKTESDVTVIVDYAHTPDALSKAIKACKTHTAGNVRVVFGCGGDRDSTKRPVMARVAEKLAQYIIVTHDNPRTESPESIIKDICLGFANNLYKVIEDRREAIEYSILQASPGDTVLLAGKGHETYQIIGDERIDFDDMEIAEQALQQRNQNTNRGLAI